MTQIRLKYIRRLIMDRNISQTARKVKVSFEYMEIFITFAMKNPPGPSLYRRQSYTHANAHQPQVEGVSPVCGWCAFCASII